MVSADSAHQNRLLARVTAVTSIGDFISFFAVLVYVNQVSGSVLLASYSVPIKSLGVAVGGLTFPSILSRFSTKRLLMISQLMSGVLMGLLALTLALKPEPALVLGVLFLQTILRQYFDGARETHSKYLGKISDHRTLQAELLQGFYSAQFIGPIIAFLLVRDLSLSIPLWIDSTSFFVAAVLCSRLHSTPRGEPMSILRPFSYLWSSPGLLRIFIIRSVGYWLPVGLFNFLLFSVIQEHYQKSLIDSAWAYSLIGLGSILSAKVLRNPDSKLGSLLHERKDAEIALLSLIALSVTRIAFLTLPSLAVALAVLFAGGICNGLNAVSTQSLRRKLTTDQQFPEIVGLELVVGRTTEWGVATLALLAITRGLLTYQSGVWLSAGLLIVLGLAHTSDRLQV